MRLTRKLLGHLNRVFAKDPLPRLALRLNYGGGGTMRWTVADGILSTTVQGGPGGPLSMDLSLSTIGGLAAELAQRPGYSVPYVAPDLAGLGALALLDASGDQATSNGDHLFVYTSPLWSYLEANGYELMWAEGQIRQMLLQLATTTAEGEWLDLLGSYYAVPRLLGEADRRYGTRIIAEVLLPKGNNIAIEEVIRRVTGQQATVTDVVVYGNPEPKFDGLTTFDGTHHFDALANPTYGLFDVAVGYDVVGGTTLTAFIAQVRAQVERLRDAGTQLRAIAAGGSALEDAVPAALGPDTAAIIETTTAHFDGLHRFGGAIAFSGPVVSHETLSG